MLPRALVATALLATALPAALAHAESAPLPPPTPAVDLLVVVDSAPAMADHRAALAAQIDAFIDALYQRFDLGGGPGLSLHVGFITSDLGAGPASDALGCVAGGDEGRMRAVAAPGCEGPTGAYLRAEVNEWGDTSANFEGDVADAVACITPVTLDGCGFQQPLRAAITALDGSNAENAGFLRDDAVLAVLFVTSQDDCSADADFFDPKNTAIGHPSPFRCAQRGWSCTQPLDGTPQVHTGCAPRDDSPHFAAPGAIADALAGLKWDRRKLVIGVLAGAAGPVETVAGPALGASCGGATTRSATPALRLDAVAASFPDRHVTGAICDEPIAMLAELATVIRTATEPGWSDPGPDGGIVCDAGGDGPARDAGGDEVGVTGHNLGCGCAADGGGDMAGGALVLLAMLGVVRRRRR